MEEVKQINTVRDQRRRLTLGQDQGRVARTGSIWTGRGGSEKDLRREIIKACWGNIKNASLAKAEVCPRKVGNSILAK